MTEYALQVLGVGNGADDALGCAAMVVERAGEPLLLVDCGHGTLNRFRQRYGCWPRALYLTHCHLDHLADLEKLVIAAALGHCPQPRIYLHAALVERLLRIFDNFPAQMAEGGMNFAEALQLVPVLNGFWCHGELFQIHEVRHHLRQFCFALHLPGVLFYSGDTRPIPELLAEVASAPTLVVHDVSLLANPSHSGASELLSYPAELRQRLWLYHYARPEQADELAALGLQPLRLGQRLLLPPADGSHPARQWAPQ